MTNTPQKLLPCPFCGSREIKVERDGPEFPAFVVLCVRCGASIDAETDCIEFGESLPFDRWNTRSLSPVMNDDVVEALTPSGDTKAAYLGEFSFNVIDRDEDGEEVPRKVLVPWATIKEIMAAIRKRAAFSSLPMSHEGGAK